MTAEGIGGTRRIGATAAGNRTLVTRRKAGSEYTHGSNEKKPALWAGFGFRWWRLRHRKVLDSYSVCASVVAIIT